MIPGPTPVPEKVLQALGRHPIGHRTKEFQELVERTTKNLQWLHQNLLKANFQERQMQLHKLWSKKEKPIKLEAYSFGKCFRSISNNYSIYLYL